MGIETKRETHTTPPADPEVRRRAEAELDAFVRSLGLSAVERQAACFVAQQLSSAADQIAVISCRVAGELIDTNSIRSSGLAIALKASDVRARTEREVCPCAVCVRGRRRVHGWLRRLVWSFYEVAARIRRWAAPN